jgi:putative oxidoreductase
MSNQSVEKLGATITRLTFGVVLLAHGLLKVLVFTVPGTVGFFGSLGLPPSIAYLTIFGEIVGGSAIILGLYTRLAAILSLPIMLGALWVHSGNGWLFSNEGGGWEFTLVLVALAVAVAFQGNGAFAIRKFPILDNFVPRPLRS